MVISNTNLMAMESRVPASHLHLDRVRHRYPRRPIGRIRDEADVTVIITSGNDAGAVDIAKKVEKTLSWSAPAFLSYYAEKRVKLLIRTDAVNDVETPKP